MSRGHRVVAPLTAGLRPARSEPVEGCLRVLADYIGPTRSSGRPTTPNVSSSGGTTPIILRPS